jgi:hypothetical protein
MLYADGTAQAAFAGRAFADSADVLVVRGAAREWVIDAESGVLMSDSSPSEIETVGLVGRTDDGWTAELVRVEGGDLAVLVAPGVSLFGGPFPGWGAVTNVWFLPSAKGWGFSPSGRTLVLVGPAMVWTYARVSVPEHCLPVGS